MLVFAVLKRQGVLDLNTETFRGLPAQRNLPPELGTPPYKMALVTGILRVGPGVVLLRRQRGRIGLPMILKPAVQLVQDHMVENG